MNEFTLFWRTGESETVKGETIAKAMASAGYSAGALKALDFYGAGNIRNHYVWDYEKKTWNCIFKI